MNKIRQVLDLTLAIPFITSKIKNWYVFEETAMSDHAQIKIDVESEHKITEAPN